MHTVGLGFSHTPHTLQCKAFGVRVCSSTRVCERERQLSPKAILVNGKVFKYLQMDLITLQNMTVSISKQPGSIWCLLSSGKFPLWAELPSLSFQPNSLQVA